jgi:hypothetical protein
MLCVAERYSGELRKIRRIMSNANCRKAAKAKHNVRAPHDVRALFQNDMSFISERQEMPIATNQHLDNLTTTQHLKHNDIETQGPHT